MDMGCAHAEFDAIEISTKQRPAVIAETVADFIEKLSPERDNAQLIYRWQS